MKTDTPALGKNVTYLLWGEVPKEQKKSKEQQRQRYNDEVKRQSESFNSIATANTSGQ